MNIKLFFLIAVLLAISGLERVHSQEEDFPVIWAKDLPNTIALSDLFFSHDSKRLFCYKVANENVFIFDIPDGNLIDDQKVFNLTQPILTKDDSHLYGIRGNRIAYYNIETGIDESIFEPGDTTFDIYDVSVDENYIVTADKKSLKLWDAKTGKVLREKKLNIDLKYLLSIQHTLKVSCDNSKIYFQSLYNYNDYWDNSWVKKQFNVYDFNTLDSISKFDIGTEKFFITNDCKLLALRHPNKPQFDIYDTELNQTITTIIENVSAIRQAYFTSDNRYLIASKFTGGIFMWNVITGEMTDFKKGGTPQVMNISLDQKYLAGSVDEILFLINISKTTGIKEPNEITDILYPNPSTGEIIISGIESPVNTISILNMDGQIIHDFRLKEIIFADNQIRLNLGFAPSGTYLLRINAVSFTKTYKLIINR